MTATRHRWKWARSTSGSRIQLRKRATWCALLTRRTKTTSTPRTISCRLTCNSLKLEGTENSSPGKRCSTDCPCSAQSLLTPLRFHVRAQTVSPRNHKGLGAAEVLSGQTGTGLAHSSLTIVGLVLPASPRFSNASPRFDNSCSLGAHERRKNEARLP